MARHSCYSNYAYRCTCFVVWQWNACKRKCLKGTCFSQYHRLLYHSFPVRLTLTTSKITTSLLYHVSHFSFQTCTKSTRFITPFWNSEERAAWYILIMQANEMHYFSNLFMIKNSTCFGQIDCTSSGVSTLYTQQLVFFMQLCWLSASRQST